MDRYHEVTTRLETPGEFNYRRRFICDCGGRLLPDEPESDEGDYPKVKVRGCSRGCMLVDLTLQPFTCLVCGSGLEAVTELFTYEVRPPLVDFPEERQLPGLTRLECPNGCIPEYTE